VVARTGKNVREMLHAHVEESATIMTDEFPLYGKATAGFAGHGVVTHKEGEQGGCLKGCLFFFLSPLSQDSLQVTYQKVR
jgi:hypothetical protein